MSPAPRILAHVLYAMFVISIIVTIAVRAHPISDMWIVESRQTVALRAKKALRRGGFGRFFAIVTLRRLTATISRAYPKVVGKNESI